MPPLLIIGQGLAGTILAWQAYFRGLSFSIIDCGNHNASKTAGGLIDPLAGQRYLQAWQADTVIPYLIPFYRRIETELETPFLRLRNSIRFFTSESDKALWLKKQDHPSVSPYFVHPHNVFFSEAIEAPLGGIEVTPSGNLDTKVFLEASRDFFENLGIYSHEIYDIHHVNPKILTVFCEGYKAQFNPYFSHLPWNSSKGNVLMLHTSLPESHILHKGKWVLPLGENMFKLGSTYSVDISSEAPDPSAETELMTFMNTFNKNESKILHHEAGIRPILKDNKPVLGRHPQHHHIGIFNGLGSRGVSLGPYLANHLLDYLFSYVPLMAEVDVGRF
jgi:glycine oxidase